MSYDPTIGRWTAEDPIAFEGGDANLYRYVGNSSTNLTDPLGLQAMAFPGPKRPSPNRTPFDGGDGPRQTFKWPDRYFRDNFTPGDLTNPNTGVAYPKYMIFNQGCVGLTKLRVGSPIAPGGTNDPGVWFNDPQAAWNYWNSLSAAQQSGSVVVAIQSLPYPTNVEPMTPQPGRIWPGFRPGGDYNYCTWHNPNSGSPFWEYANGGSNYPGGMNVYRDPKLSPKYPGPPIIGIVPSTSPDRHAR